MNFGHFVEGKWVAVLIQQLSGENGERLFRKTWWREVVRPGRRKPPPSTSTIALPKEDNIFPKQAETFFVFFKKKPFRHLPLFCSLFPGFQPSEHYWGSTIGCQALLLALRPLIVLILRLICLVDGVVQAPVVLEELLLQVQGEGHRPGGVERSACGAGGKGFFLGVRVRVGGMRSGRW